MYAQAITSALSQQLPRGTYVKWNVDKWLEVDSYMEKETKEQPQENTQEELAQ
jgi:hypothetical protein